MRGGRHISAELLDTGRGVRLYREPHGFTVVRPWRGWCHVAGLAVGLVAGGFAVRPILAAGGAIFSAGGPGIRWSVAFIAVAALYYALTGFNRTVVRIARDGIEIRRGPLPVLGSRLRRLPPVVSVAIRFDRVVAYNAVGHTHVVEGTLASGQCVTIDLVNTKDKAESMCRLLQRALEPMRSGSVL